MAKIIIMIILVNIVIRIIIGSYDQSFIFKDICIYSDLCIYSVNKVAIYILETREISRFSE